MGRFAWVLVVGSSALAACAHDPGARAPSTLPQIGWSGPPPRVGVQLAGSGAGGDRQAECEAGARAAGVVVEPSAPVMAVVTLDGGATRVDLVSQRRGVVRSEKRPPLPVDELCAQAAVAAAAALRDEQGGLPMDSDSNAYAITPVHSQDLHSPTAPPVGPEPDPRASRLGAGANSSGPMQ